MDNEKQENYEEGRLLVNKAWASTAHWVPAPPNQGKLRKEEWYTRTNIMMQGLQERDSKAVEEGEMHTLLEQTYPFGIQTICFVIHSELNKRQSQNVLWCFNVMRALYWQYWH